MTTYVYETIPSDNSIEPQQFEFRQRMTDQPLTRHPETGEPVRRVISGGLGYLQKGQSSSTAASSCGSGCGCH
ncbi:MAG: zinc ribbon domain-containing protein [bacterium]